MSLTVFCALIESCSVQMGMCFVHKEFQLELQVYFCHPIKMLCTSVYTVRCIIAIKIINDNIAILLQRLWVFVCFRSVIVLCHDQYIMPSEQLVINAIFML